MYFSDTSRADFVSSQDAFYRCTAFSSKDFCLFAMIK